MVDQIVETGNGTSKPGLEAAVAGLGEGLRSELKENGALSLDELLTSVYKWENEHGEKLSDEEFEVLEILSLTLGASKSMLEKTVGLEVTNADKESAYLQSINAQQDIVKTVLANLDQRGQPNKAVLKSLSLTAEIFGEYFDDESPKITDPGASAKSGYWQGVQGMITTAILFHEAGWEIDYPKPEHDLHYDVDLHAITPSGKVYAIDITAKVPQILDDTGGLSPSFNVNQARMPNKVLREEIPNLKGYIKINVPSMKHHSSYDFYEDRLTGYPNEGAFSEFRQNIDKFS